MNTLKGVIRRITTDECFNRVEVEAAGGMVFRVMTLELKETFQENRKIAMLFKESDVVISKGRLGQVSIENRFSCTVHSVDEGRLFVEVMMAIPFGTVRALVCRETYDHMKLASGDRVNIFIKAGEISLMEDNT